MEIGYTDYCTQCTYIVRTVQTDILLSYVGSLESENLHIVFELFISNLIATSKERFVFG